MHSTTLVLLLFFAQLQLVFAVAAPRKAPGEVFDTYLGMLYPTEDFKVYGYISNTRIKFMLVVDEMLQKEDEMRMVRLDTAYSERNCSSPGSMPRPAQNT